MTSNLSGSSAMFAPVCHCPTASTRNLPICRCRFGQYPYWSHASSPIGRMRTGDRDACAQATPRQVQRRKSKQRFADFCAAGQSAVHSL
jgi:hypothetical protein